MYINLVHVGASVLVEFVVGAEDDESDLAVAEHAQLVRLLHHAELALVERHLEYVHNYFGGLYYRRNFWKGVVLVPAMFEVDYIKFCSP